MGNPEQRGYIPNSNEAATKLSLDGLEERIDSGEAVRGVYSEEIKKLSEKGNLSPEEVQILTNAAEFMRKYSETQGQLIDAQAERISELEGRIGEYEKVGEDARLAEEGKKLEAKNARDLKIREIMDSWSSEDKKLYRLGDLKEKSDNGDTIVGITFQEMEEMSYLTPDQLKRIKELKDELDSIK